MTIPAAIPKRKLRWYQFSLRTLLVFVTLFACICSWLTVKAQRAKRQREAVRAILGGGGEVIYDCRVAVSDRGRSCTFDCSTPDDKVAANPPRPEWLVNWLGIDLFSNVVFVRVDNDAPLEPLAELESVRDLRIGDEIMGSMCPSPSEVRGDRPSQEWKYVKSLPRLRGLTLSASGITDEEMEFLRALPRLEILRLNYNPITDKGLICLADLKNLRELSLAQCFDLTDDALVNLKCLTRLERLDLTLDGRITDAGIAAIREALPNCKISQ